MAMVMNVLVVIQARMGSTRLPGKVLLPLAGEPLLLRMVERVRAAHTPFTLVVATTTEPADDAIVALCHERDILCFRGHPTDLLERHYRAGITYRADAVVKIPSDCPMIDPAVIDRVLGSYLASPERWDYMSNLHPGSYPDGNDVEVMSMGALRTAWEEAELHFEREHTTPYLWDHPDRFRCGNVLWESGWDLSMTHRWTIDYPEDYTFLTAVFNALYSREHPIFRLEQVLALIEESRAIAEINAHLCGVNWYRHHIHDLRTVSLSETRV
jgi:spore coat polysaccharide biosynthesis protein SpsF